MESAQELGRRAARQLRASGAPADVRRLAGQMGIQVIVCGSPPPAQPGLRSEYRSAPPRITLYCQAIASLLERLEAASRGELLACDLEGVHLAHELFHHLQGQQRLGPLSRDASEAAAHAFAQELLRLSFDPSLLS